MIPVVLAISGVDPSGCAGIYADLRTLAACRVHGAGVVTALTAQNTRGVQAISPVEPELVAAELGSVLSDLKVRAVKIGMVPNAEVAMVIAEALRLYPDLPVVLDPVLRASTGRRLAAGSGDGVLSELLRSVSLLTPNLPEAATLLGEAPARTDAEAEHQARRILHLGPRAVLLKGGHGEGAESVDWLVTDSGSRRYAAPRLAARNNRGTGCTLASAIAAGLARGVALEDAVAQAKDYVGAALAASAEFDIGSGPGPVNHFHALWS
jgi:hydroxymethylpyrimidine/phosphomethylpyrimidine kinase